VLNIGVSVTVVAQQAADFTPKLGPKYKNLFLVISMETIFFYIIVE
jgi:hypothetical protein